MYDYLGRFTTMCAADNFADVAEEPEVAHESRTSRGRGVTMEGNPSARFIARSMVPDVIGRRAPRVSPCRQRRLL